MVEKLRNMFKDKYEITYTSCHDLEIFGKVDVKDFIFIKQYLKMYRIHIRNIIVESW